VPTAPKNPAAELRAWLEKELSEPLPDWVWRVLTGTRWAQEYAAPHASVLERGQAKTALLDFARALRKHGPWKLAEASDITILEPSPQTSTGKKDERWDLWRELRTAAGNADPWAPLTLSRVFDETSAPALSSERVEVSFDSRMPCSVLIGQIRALWPRLKEERWVRTTRTVDQDSADRRRWLALIRHVCLETPPDTSWPERTRLWNEKYPRYAYKDQRDFAKNFHRAEQQLTGWHFGLEWFYDTAARGWETPALLTVDDDRMYDDEGNLREIPIIELSPEEEWRMYRHLASEGRERDIALQKKIRRFQQRGAELVSEGLTLEETSARMIEEDAEWAKWCRPPGSPTLGVDTLRELLFERREDWRDWAGSDLGEERVERANGHPKDRRQHGKA
jgi:hypothetical protein